VPPSISKGVSSQGANRDSSIAAGSRITILLNTDPREIFQTMGSSRAAGRFWRYFGETAVSSMTTPSDFVPAFAASSMTDAATLTPARAACDATS